MTESEFRKYLYPRDDARLQGFRTIKDAYEYREAAKVDPFTGMLIRGWEPLYFNDFVGVTSDGNVIPDLYTLENVPAGDEAPTAAMVEAANAFLASLTPEQRTKVQYEVTAKEWQGWANPEFMQHDIGLRMEFEPDATKAGALSILEASLSPEGYAFARNLMKINGFLGDLNGIPQIMNEFSYNFAIYGEPSLTAPWGWHWYGHHVVFNCLVVGTQMIITPVFLAAEPDSIDEGPDNGVVVFAGRIELGHSIMDELTAEQRQKAIIYDDMMNDPRMPADRYHPGDGLHLGGAFQDNRVIPYEGVRLSECSDAAKQAVSAFVADFISYLPEGPRRVRQREIESHYNDTYFSWIGGIERGDVYYLRIQSPVALIEIDHHCGVFLSNDHPERFHMHTVVRTPNGNDYGKALVKQYFESQA
jgi:hypothetical protein